MPTQVQIRRAAAATQNARTLASGELDFDTTNKRLSVHDGSTVGGIKHATAKDMQNNSFGYVNAAGTNTITATYAPAPTARAAGQRWTFKAANTITGAATFNPNSLGASTIYKKNASTNTIIAVAANDILAGGVYTVVDVDGSTAYQLEYAVGGGLTTVKQGDLSTLTGSVSASGGYVALPGGEYGFYPQVRSNTANHKTTAQMAATSNSYVTGIQIGAWSMSVPTSVTHGGRELTTGSGGSTQHTGVLAALYTGTDSLSVNTAFAQQRYVQACPPYDLGDGEMMGFGFLKVNSAGEIVSSYMADDPPWANNGPTDIRPTRVCPMTGQEYVRQKKMPSLRDVLDGAPVEYAEVPLTQKIKNADMKVIPHPFGSCEDGETIILLDPMDERVRRLMNYQNDGGDIGEFLKYVKPDNEALRRKQIKGVRQVSFKL